MLQTVEQKLIRYLDSNGVADPDTTQCMAIGERGQCPYRAEPGCKNCARHNGGVQLAQLATTSMRSYRLMQWQERCQQFADSSEVKSLRGEIGITRMTLESVIVDCKSPNDLLIASGKITLMVEQIRKLVVSCQQLEGQLGIMLDKNQVMILGSQIVEIVGRYIKDSSVIDSIALEIGNAILNMSPATEVELNT